jgi:hypothetical protein
MLHTKHSMCDPLLVQVNALGAGLLLGSALVIILPEGMVLDHKHTLQQALRGAPTEGPPTRIGIISMFLTTFLLNVCRR